MRRFRRRRRRLAALALLPITATFIMTSALTPATATESAGLEASTNRVEVGERVTLRGSFDVGAGRQVEIRQRSGGGKRWRTAGHARTDENGRWRARVKPRRTGLWRAALVGEPESVAAPEPTDESSPEGEPAPAGESATERIRVRSRIAARVSGRHAIAGEEVRIRGRVAPAGVRSVVVRIGGRRERTKTDRRGRFSVEARVARTGSFPLRVRARGNRRAGASSDRLGRLTVYRRASASWYGPGLYGNRTACGQTLTPSTVGVAHKSMPCGTKLRLRYRGRAVAVRVIDRGPYVAGREFDLTSATRNRLGFGSTGTVLSSR